MAKKIGAKNIIDLTVLAIQIGATAAVLFNDKRTSSTERLLDMSDNTVVQSSKVMTYIPKDDMTAGFIKDEKTIDTKKIL